jgi:ketosteroid isomerase-like protein
MSATLLNAVKLASETWKNGFNTQDAQQCAAQYEANATMNARPFGEFVGRDAIEAFWQNLINEGFNSVEYIEPQFSVVDNSTVLITSAWKMNKAHGVIHKELWVLQDDGSAKLSDDDFEVLG